MRPPQYWKPYLLQLKNLSATCRTLRTSFCARVTVITLSDAADASKLCCTTWPQLMMVVFENDATRGKLSAQWEIMMEIELLAGGCVSSRQTVMLFRSYHQLNAPLTDLPSQHCAALSDFAVKCRGTALVITLQGPCVGCGAVQSLTNSICPLEIFEAGQSTTAGGG